MIRGIIKSRTQERGVWRLETQLSAPASPGPAREETSAAVCQRPPVGLCPCDCETLRPLATGLPLYTAALSLLASCPGFRLTARVGLLLNPGPKQSLKGCNLAKDYTAASQPSSAAARHGQRSCGICLDHCPVPVHRHLHPVSVSVRLI